MTTYKGLKGTKIQNITSDAIVSQIEGGSWASGGALNTGRSNMGPGGVQTAAIVAGGSPNTAVVETYDGSSWTEIADINTSRWYMASSTAGTTTAHLIMGGGPPQTAAA